MRREFSVFNLQNIESERLMLVSEKKVLFYTFTGTKINRTLKLLFDAIEIKNILDDRTSMFYIMISKEEFLSKLNLINSNIEIIDEIVTKELEKNPESLTLSKWGVYLPLKFQIRLMKQNYYDIIQTQEFLHNINGIVENL